MNILIYNAYYFPETAASMHLEKDIAEGFASDNDVTMYVPVPSRGVTDETRKEYKKKKLEYHCDGRLKIVRYNLMKESRNPVLRAYRYFIQNIKQYGCGIATDSVDVIFSGSTPPTQGAMCSLVKRKLCKKYKNYVPYVFNLQDIFPDSLVNAGMTREGSILWKIGRKIEDFTYKNADAIIVISENFKRNIMAKGVPEEKITVISNWADTGAIIPIPRKENKIIQRYHLDPEKTFITYSGNIGMSQNMDLLLDTAKRLINELPNLQFIIIGDGVDRERVQKRVTDESITNIAMLPFQPYEDIAHVFNLGDIGLIISKKGIGSNSVPSKTWGYMAAGKPILTSFDLDSELVRIIEDKKCGYCAEPDNAAALAEGIRTLIACNSLDALGKSGRNYIENELSAEKGINGYIDVISSTVQFKKEEEK